jgi:hypothetical protein
LTIPSVAPLFSPLLMVKSEIDRVGTSHVPCLSMISIHASDTIMAALEGLWLDWTRRHSETAIQNGLEGCIRLVNIVLAEKR